MTARYTSGQKRQAEKLAGDAFVSVNPSKDDGARRILEHPQLSSRLKALFTELAAEFYNLLTDAEAIAWIVKHGKKSKDEAIQIVNGWRQKARAAGVVDSVSLHTEVKADCLFKRDMSKMGPVWEEFKYLQDWDFPDPPTEHVLLSWIPAPLTGSTSQNVTDQTATVATFKTNAGLPAWYDVSFGSVNHAAGMALAHFKATGKDPFAGLVVRTDTCDSDGGRLRLRWGQGRLLCDVWDWAGDGGPSVAVFALGVVKALGR